MLQALGLFLELVLKCYFSMESRFLLLENGVRNQDLGAGCACRCWGVVISRPSQLIEQEMHLHHLTHVYTHIHKYLYM